MITVDSSQLDSALTACIKRQALATITMRTDDWHVYKTTLQSGSVEGGIALSQIPKAEQVGISVRKGNHKLIFASPLQNGRLAWPAKAAYISRRAYDRCSLKELTPVQFSKYGNRYYDGHIVDISTGGMKASTRSRDFLRGTYHCRFGGFSLQALLKKDSSSVLTFQFVGLEFDFATLNRLMRFVRERKLEQNKSAPALVNRH